MRLLKNSFKVSIPISAVLFLLFSISAPAIIAKEIGSALKDIEAPLVSPTDAHKIIDKASTLSIQRIPAVTQGIALSETDTTSEIEELARGLQYDPELIYKYVRNHIDYTPIYGSIKDGASTYINGSGNDFDQVSLFIALMRASGYTANYIYGTVTYPGSEAANWLGVMNQEVPLSDILGSAAIPATINTGEGGVVTSVTIDHVWAKVNIDETDYVFDPSFKQYATSSRLDIGQIMGYDEASFLSAVENGATIDSTFTQNLNSTNLKNMLVSYSMNLHSYLKSNFPNGSIEDVLGRREIIPEQTMPRQTSLPFPYAISSEWTEIPDSYRHHFRIQHQGIDHTFATYQIYGKRLSIFYNGSTPELRLDGELIASGSSSTSGNLYDITLSIDHPYAADSGTYGDQTYTREIEAGRQYVITANFGGMARNLIVQHNRILTNNIRSGLSNDSEAVMGESLHLRGLVYQTQCDLAANLAGKISDNVNVIHHYIGFVGQSDSPFIDMPLGFGSTVSVNNDQVSEDACRYALGGIFSAFEHAMMIQLQNMDAVSTIRLFWIANNEGDKIFTTDVSNWDDIKPQLDYYNPDVLNTIESDYINNGYNVILPQNGGITLNQWTGAGYIVHNPVDGSTGYIIWGSLFGGTIGTIGSVNSPDVNKNSENMGSNGDNGSKPPESSEPVNMESGAYLYRHTDLTLGQSGNPKGIKLDVYYNSNNRYGWDQSYNISITKGSDGFQGMGKGLHFNAIGTIAELFITIDLWRAPHTHAERMIATLSHTGFVSILINNEANLQMGDKIYEFIRLPNGTYSPPPGMTDELVEHADGTYTLTRRFGTVLQFNTAGKIQTWTDANGNVMEFYYDQNQSLTAVTDAFGRGFTVSNNNNIATVTDSSGRTVQYQFNTDGNIGSITDPEGHTRQFVYDSEHRLAEIYTPSGQRLVTNVYDSQNRVVQQTNGRGYNFQFLWSDYRNVEKDPSNKEHVFFFDKKGHFTVETDKTGATTNYTYDGQNHVISITDPLGNTTLFAYDGNNNLSSITTALNHTTGFTYDAENRLRVITDPLGNAWTYVYDTHHNLESITDPLGGSINYTYDPKGRVASITNQNGNTANISYDGSDCQSTYTDALGHSTTFVCDSIGNYTSMTDPNGNTYSFAYDLNRRLTGITDPYGTLTYAYNSDGNRSSRTDQKGNFTEYAYNENFNLTTITYPTYSVQRVYDELDNLIQVIDPAGTSAFGYNEEGKLTSYTDKNSYVLNFTYNLAGNTSSITYPGSKTVTYTYDAENQLKNILDWTSGQTSYSNYDERGLLLNASFPNGSTVQYDYDDAARMTSLENMDSVNQNIASYFHTLDPVGNIIIKDFDQTISPSISSADISFSYGSDNRLTSFNGTSLQYDGNGNLIQKGSATYEYDYENRLIRVTTPSDTWEYIYNGLGQRIGMIHNDKTKWYLIDPRGFSQVMGEYTDSDMNAYYIHGLGLISMIDAADHSYCFHYDFTGSTAAITDSAGNIMNKYAYTPFGEPTGREEAVSNPFRYVGEFGVMDDGNGLYYMRARYYDPEVGRFINKDPIGFLGGMNLYGYVGNNPINIIDPIGLCEENEQELIDKKARENLNNVFEGWRISETYCGSDYCPNINFPAPPRGTADAMVDIIIENRGDKGFYTLPPDLQKRFGR